MYRGTDDPSVRGDNLLKGCHFGSILYDTEKPGRKIAID